MNRLPPPVPAPRAESQTTDRLIKGPQTLMIIALGSLGAAVIGLAIFGWVVLTCSG